LTRRGRPPIAESERKVELKLYIPLRIKQYVERTGLSASRFFSKQVEELISGDLDYRVKEIIEEKEHHQQEINRLDNDLKKYNSPILQDDKKPVKIIDEQKARYRKIWDKIPPEYREGIISNNLREINYFSEWMTGPAQTNLSAEAPDVLVRKFQQLKIWEDDKT